VNAKYPRAFKDNVQQTKDYYAVYVEIFDETDASLEDIAAPVEVRDVAGEILATEAKMSVVHHDRLDQLKDVTTGDELNTVFKLNQDYQDLSARDTVLCGQLAQLADEYHVAFEAPCSQ